MKRKLGTCWGFAGPLPKDERITLMKENGFVTTFMGSEAKDLGELVKYIRAAGIDVDNYHAPFDKINDIWKPGEEGDAMYARLLDGVEKCVKYDVPAIVVHLSSGLKPPVVNEVGFERWSRLQQIADDNGVLLCYENQRMLSNLAMAFEQFPKAAFCWDCGHESCFTPGRHYMPLYGSKLKALHIHDNWGKFNGDDHMIPYEASMDFDYVAEMIAASKYEGTLMLELIKHKSGYYEETPSEEYARRAGLAAARLAAAVEKFDEKYV